MNKTRMETNINAFFAKMRQFSQKNIAVISFVFVVLLVLFLIDLFGWWSVIGILILKFGLGLKVAGAKTFSTAILKAGGKKAVATTAGAVLAKRHIIDVASKFFVEHSFEKYKRTLILVASRKFEEIKAYPPIKKIKAAASLLLSIPPLYFLWTKVISTAFQKMIYALILPIASLIWNIVSNSLNFIGFLLEIIVIGGILEYIKKYRWGRSFVYIIDGIVAVMAKGVSILLDALSYAGIDITGFILKTSIRFNKWLEKILYKGLSKADLITARRDRYLNAVEALSEKRQLYKIQKREKKISFIKTFKKSFEKHITKKKTWREKREDRKKKREKEHPFKKRHQRRTRHRIHGALILPYHCNI